MTRRRMRLSAELVARAPASSGNYSVDRMMEGRRLATDADHDSMAREILDGAADRDSVWVFAYGSLIWNPAFDFVEQRAALVSGWHRSFCLGWDEWFRGCSERPGLMLALDRGGRCKGAAYRLPPEAAEANLVTLVKREVHILPHPFPPRWINLVTANGPLRAVTFTMDRGSDAYVAGLAPDALADVLATAAGQWGSMAEYLFNTVSHLEELGLRDRHLWRLQELVADRLEAMADAG